MIGELTREHETNDNMNLVGQESSLLVVGRKLSHLTSNASKDIADE